jgi:hypothetical protein
MEKQLGPKPSNNKDSEKGDQMDDQKWEKGKKKRNDSKHDTGDWKEWTVWQLKGIRLDLPPPWQGPAKVKEYFLFITLMHTSIY